MGGKKGKKRKMRKWKIEIEQILSDLVISILRAKGERNQGEDLGDKWIWVCEWRN